VEAITNGQNGELNARESDSARTSPPPSSAWLPKATAKRVGWLCGGVIAAGLAAWIHFVQKPSAALMGGWVGVVLAAFWLCARAATELCYGVLRFRHRPGNL